MGKGRRFELDTKNSINDATRTWVKAHRPDFSGNSRGEVADVMVVWQSNRYDAQQPCGHPERHVAYVELKKVSGVTEGNRKVVMSGSSDGQSGLDELHDLRAKSPPWSETYVGIKFSNRELIVLDSEALEHWVCRDEEGWGQRYYVGPRDDLHACEQHGARLTNGMNISMRKPTLDNWPSSTAGEDDHIKLLHGIGVEDYDISEDY